MKSNLQIFLICYFTTYFGGFFLKTIFENQTNPQLAVIIKSEIVSSQEYPNPMRITEFYPFPKHGEYAWLAEQNSSRFYPGVIRIEDPPSVKLKHLIQIYQIIDTLKRSDGSTYTEVRETFGRKINP